MIQENNTGNKKITVTSPLLPPLEEFIPYLEDIWGRRWLTNNGHYHQELEAALCRYLNVEHISLFVNGTLALITALQALRINGDVITTPYSFVASTHSLWWNGIRPVFADIDPQTFNLDPEKIEAAITPKTTAIMPVHVYGTPCNVQAIQRIAETYNLKVVYDAAHAFGVTLGGDSILNFGDLSVLSFHATKTYNTIEGGAIICHSPEMKRHIDDLKNFGFRNEVTVVAPGINAKMNELQAAYGLLALRYVDAAIAHRKKLSEQYRAGLDGTPGISFMRDMPEVKHNYSYFPIFVDERRYGMSRDALYEKLKENDIYGRRYFYPLISQFATYRGLDSAQPGRLSIAERVAQEVICLPIYADLGPEAVEKICGIIQRKER
jgi:dTDP-4-amino-4,6-dideoxygalactose transaminase